MLKNYLFIAIKCAIVYGVKAIAKDEIIGNIKRVSYLVEEKYIEYYLNHFQVCALWIR